MVWPHVFNSLPAGNIPALYLDDNFNNVHGLFNAVKVFTVSGTYTPPTNLSVALVYVVGGGGGSAGAPATGAGQISCGTSGGGGAVAVSLLTSSQIGASQTVTVGAAGAAGAAGANGGNAGTSSLGTLLSAAGGLGGSAAPAAAVIQLAGGSGGAIPTTGNVFNFPGISAENASLNGSFHFLGKGGGTFLGFGEGGVHNTDQGSNTLPGHSGLGFGAGATGPINSASAAAQVGIAGEPGLVLILEYVNS